MAIGNVDLSGLGLDEASTQFVESLAEDIQEVIVKSFDAKGTKDGNVFGRLLGFARSIWAKRMANGGSSQDVVGMIRGYPDDVQAKIISAFDASGSKDGNILGRLERFSASVAGKAGVGKGQSKGKSKGEWGAPPPAKGKSKGKWEEARAPPPRRHSAPQDDYGGLSGGAIPSSSGHVPSEAAATFCANLGLDEAQAGFLSGLPAEVQERVFRSFDPAGTKDGNVWGRLFGFVRTVWNRAQGLDKSCVDMIKGLPEDAQCTVMLKFDPGRSTDGNIAARLEAFCRSVGGKGRGAPVRHGAPPAAAWGHAQASAEWEHPQSQWHAQRGAPAPHWQPSLGHGGGYPPRGGYARAPPPMSPVEAFVRQWDLNPEAGAFLADLPETVSSSVFGSFTASGTKDGNVWGRLFGFVRSVWQKKLRVGKEASDFVKRLPEEAQMMVMVHFDPARVRGGDEVGYIQSIADGSMQPQQHWGHGPPQRQEAQSWARKASNLSYGDGGLSGDISIDEFARNCNLDSEGVSFLESLSDDVRSTVMSAFDPSGTKDGNVLGRLQGFARSVENRRKRGGDGGGGRNTRQRLH